MNSKKIIGAHLHKNQVIAEANVFQIFDENHPCVYIINSEKNEQSWSLLETFQRTNSSSPSKLFTHNWPSTKNTHCKTEILKGKKEAKGNWHDWKWCLAIRRPLQWKQRVSPGLCRQIYWEAESPAELSAPGPSTQISSLDLTKGLTWGVLETPNLSPTQNLSNHSVF